MIFVILMRKQKALGDVSSYEVSHAALSELAQLYAKLSLRFVFFSFRRSLFAVVLASCIILVLSSTIVRDHVWLFGQVKELQDALLREIDTHARKRTTSASSLMRA